MEIEINKSMCYPMINICGVRYPVIPPFNCEIVWVTAACCTGCFTHNTAAGGVQGLVGA